MNVSRRYNLVEVILALGVVAIGVVSIMALFPIGASDSCTAEVRLNIVAPAIPEAFIASKSARIPSLEKLLPIQCHHT